MGIAARRKQSVAIESKRGWGELLSWLLGLISNGILDRGRVKRGELVGAI